MLKLKNKNALISLVTKMEGKKVQVSRAQVAEILNILGGLIADDPSILELLLKGHEGEDKTTLYYILSRK